MKTKKQEEITWFNLKYRDVVINNDGDELMVLGVLNELVFLSWNGSFEQYSHTSDKKHLQNYGYTIKQATPVEKVKIIDGRKYQLMEE